MIGIFDGKTLIMTAIIFGAGWVMGWTKGLMVGHDDGHFCEKTGLHAKHRTTPY